MKRILLFTGLLISLFAHAQIEKVTPKKPDPQRLVNDYTNTLSADQLGALENKLVAYDDSTSNQIAVVIIKSAGDYGVEDVALKILRDWGVGGQKNNGVVLLVAKDDHKVRIETGYGLEGAIPDITAKSIIENEIVPNFRKDNYYRGIDEATDAIIKAAAGEYKAPEGYHKRSGGSGISIGKIIFIIIIVIIILSQSGGRGGGMMSRRGYRGWNSGPPIFWFPSGGGGGGGGGWSGGGGGGFGGFGGGSGGGGGASGSW